MFPNNLSCFVVFWNIFKSLKQFYIEPFKNGSRKFEDLKGSLLNQTTVSVSNFETFLFCISFELFV